MKNAMQTQKKKTWKITEEEWARTFSFTVSSDFYWSWWIAELLGGKVTEYLSTWLFYVRILVFLCRHIYCSTFAFFLLHSFPLQKLWKWRVCKNVLPCNRRHYKGTVQEGGSSDILETAVSKSKWLCYGQKLLYR